MAANTHSLDLELSSSQYASIVDGSQTGLDLSTDFTFEFYANLEQLPSTAGSLFGVISKDDVSAQRSYHMRISTANKLLVTYLDASANESSTGTDAAIFVAGDVGNWVHTAVSVDISAQAFTVYKNGSPVADTVTSSAASAIKNGTAPFIIGALTTGLQYFDGLIDEVRVWNDIRTGTEITDNKDVQLVGNEAGLVGYWRLNNNYLDETTNNNDLTASGSPVFSTSVPFTEATGNAILFGTNF